MAKRPSSSALTASRSVTTLVRADWASSDCFDRPSSSALSVLYLSDAAFDSVLSRPARSSSSFFLSASMSSCDEPNDSTVLRVFLSAEMVWSVFFSSVTAIRPLSTCFSSALAESVEHRGAAALDLRVDLGHALERCGLAAGLQIPRLAAELVLQRLDLGELLQTIVRRARLSARRTPSRVALSLAWSPRRVSSSARISFLRAVAGSDAVFAASFSRSSFWA